MVFEWKLDMQTTTLALALLLTCLFLMVSVSPSSPQNPERIALEGVLSFTKLHSFSYSTDINCLPLWARS